LRKKFSERYGHITVRDSFQVDDINEGLKSRLWNAILHSYIDIQPTLNSFGQSTSHGAHKLKDNNVILFIKKLYDGFFKTHEIPSIIKNGFRDELKHEFFKLEWFEIYDLLEYISTTYPYNDTNNKFRTKVNEVLEDEMSGYRFIDEYITPIVDDVEIEEIEQAINSEYSGAKIHLSNALEHLSDRENPDYINSIKESISAVESVVNKISGSTNVALNRAVNNIPFEIDSNFKGGIIKMYSWTSSADGIRHGVTGDTINSAFAEAKYMLVICSAFINYIIEKSK